MTQSITSTVTVLRAIGVEFARRKVQPLAIGGLVVAILAHVLGIWLITQSAWWWLLEIIFIGSTLLFIALGIAAWLLLRRVSPKLSRKQRTSVGAFVDKLERVAEHLQTPQPVIIFRVVRDAVWPRGDTFLEGVIHDSSSLGSDFSKLRKDLQ